MNILYLLVCFEWDTCFDKAVIISVNLNILHHLFSMLDWVFGFPGAQRGGGLLGRTHPPAFHTFANDMYLN